VFGFSFGELLVISLVTLVAVGPQKLPGMLKTMGQWARKLRQMTMDVRQQTGIDEMLRAEGIQLSELRTLMRGYHGPSPAPAPAPAPVASPRYEDPYSGLDPDPTREYPPEGADAYGALPDDLLEPPKNNEVAKAPGAPDPKPEPAQEPKLDEVVQTKSVGEPAAEAKPELAAVAVPPKPDSVPELEPEALVAAKPVTAPARSVAPPPPSSRPAAPRPAGAPPPPPRRTSLPAPRPEPSSPVNKPEPATAVPATPSPGSANGNG
jgi:sec-independent protein translocase protein TatB